MARTLEEMPLFPLDAVLFPYAQMPLRVFEDRYLEMVRHCLEYDLPFGIVLIRRGNEVGGPAEPYMVGTAVRIVSVEESDDQLQIKVRGERRFRVRKLDETKPYLVGYVEPVIESEFEGDPMADELVLRTHENFRMLIEMHVGRPNYNIKISFNPPDATALSFLIASMLQLDKLEKQRLLEITDTKERLIDLNGFMERLIVEARTPERVTANDFDAIIFPN